MQTYAACSREQKAPLARWDLILGAVQRPAADGLRGLNGSKWAMLHAQFVQSWKQSFYSRANICSGTFIKENRSCSYCACVTEMNEFASLQHTFEWVYSTYRLATKLCDCGERCRYRRWRSAADVFEADVAAEHVEVRSNHLCVPQSSEWPAASALVICCVISAWPKNTQPQRMMGAVVVGCEVGIYTVQSEQFSATFFPPCPE